MCLLLDKEGLPNPKELARAYFEVHRQIPPDHDDVLEAKIQEKLEEVSPNLVFKEAFVDAYNDEVKAIAKEITNKSGTVH